MNRKPATFPQRLRWAMAAREVSIEDLATRSGASVSGIKKWLGGATAPRAANLGAVAKALDVSAGWLMGESENGGPDYADLQEARQNEFLARLGEAHRAHQAQFPRSAMGMTRPGTPPAGAPARGLLWGVVDPARLNQAFRDALGRTGFDPTELGDTNALMLLTVLLHDAALKRDASAVTNAEGETEETG